MVAMNRCLTYDLILQGERARMSLYDDLGVGASDTKTEGWSKNFKLLQSQLKVKKAALTQAKVNGGAWRRGPAPFVCVERVCVDVGLNMWVKVGAEALNALFTAVDPAGEADDRLGSCH